MNVELKYGSGFVNIKIPDKQVMGIYQPKDLPVVDNLDTAVRQALANPIGSQTLSKIGKPGNSVVIVVDDATRAVPSAELLVPIVDELNQSGIPDKNICVLVATGLHRPMKQAELDKCRGKDGLIFKPYGLSKQKISFPFLVLPGQYTIWLKLITSKMKPHTASTMEISDWLSVATFEILERDKWSLNIFIAVISLIIGAGLTVLVQWLIGLY